MNQTEKLVNFSVG